MKHSMGRAIVTDAQTCGNLLAGVGPFAIERGLVAAGDETTDVRIIVDDQNALRGRFRFSHDPTPVLSPPSTA